MDSRGFDGAPADLAYSIGGLGEVLDVYDNRLVITPRGFLGFLIKGFKGAKTIPFRSITAVQFREAGAVSGYLQFTIPGGIEGRGGALEAAGGDENTFVFGASRNEIARKAHRFIEAKIV